MKLDVEDPREPAEAAVGRVDGELAPHGCSANQDVGIRTLDVALATSIE
jgi:hypothetical protein